MRVVSQSVQIESSVDGEAILRGIERAARTCYKSESRAGDFEQTKKFVRRLIDSQHESVLEHESITVRFVCDRGISHEIVRHRIASYSQESTRYCCYAKGGFGSEITVIDMGPWLEPSQHDVWLEAMRAAEASYMRLLKLGATPETARNVLPTALKTEIVVTMNLRSWRHFFRLRTSTKAHPQIRALASDLLGQLRARISVVFDDI